MKKYCYFIILQQYWNNPINYTLPLFETCKEFENAQVNFLIADHCWFWKAMTNNNFILRNVRNFFNHVAG